MAYRLRAQGVLKTELCNKLPGTKFSVKSFRNKVGLEVSWNDGPTLATVRAITVTYQKARGDLHVSCVVLFRNYTDPVWNLERATLASRYGLVDNDYTILPDELRLSLHAWTLGQLTKQSLEAREI